MKFTCNKELKEFVEELVSTNSLNMSLSDMFSEIIGNQEIISSEEVSTIKNKFHLQEKEILLNKFKDYWEIDLDNDEDEEVFSKIITPSIEEVDINTYLNNAYYTLIKQRPFKYGDYELAIDHYSPYELFPLKDIRIDSNSFLELNSFSFFKKEYPFLALNHKGVTWMSVTPNEIETMKDSINKVRGVVTVYGLGLGYYPFMVSQKEEVKEVVVIEKDKTIIDIFSKYLLPQFPNKQKIKVINKDAFDYLRMNKETDFSFIDLWHDPIDGIELYLKCKKMENSGEYHYWLESSFYALMRRCFITLIEEQYEGYDESNYKHEKSYTDKMINTYYYKTKNLTIKNREELANLLSDSSLLNLLIK